MSVRTIAMVFLALLSGASMAVGVMRSNRLNAKVLAESVETIEVVVAAADIARGAQLSAEHVRVAKWPKEHLPKGTVTKLDEAVGRVTGQQVLGGEVILLSKLTSKQSGPGLAALITPGMRAYTIQASRVASNVAGFILPGNKVDVLLNLRGGRDDETGGGSTTTLLQAVEVLAVDQRLEAPEDNKVDPGKTSSVTLLVSPEQAALLDLGQNMGLLTLSLRNPEDQSQADTRPTTVASIRYRQEKPLEKPLLVDAAIVNEPRKPESVERGIITFRGTQRGRIHVEASP